MGKLFVGDCLNIMPKLEVGSIDMILCDLPYGTTACSWDTIIPLDLLWKEYRRLVKVNATIVLTASQPFTSILVMSNLSMFKYEWIWQKAVGSNFAVLKYQPMKEHENVLVFGGKKSLYQPIMEARKGSGNQRVKYKYNALETTTGEANGSLLNIDRTGQYGELRNPSSIQYFNNREDCRGLHPTQKPVALFEYLVKTYTNEGNTVLDNCCGSGTTGVACQNLKRNFILIEQDLEYAKIAQKRLIDNAARLKNELS